MTRDQHAALHRLRTRSWFMKAEARDLLRNRRRGTRRARAIALAGEAADVLEKLNAYAAGRLVEAEGGEHE